MSLKTWYQSEKARQDLEKEDKERVRRQKQTRWEEEFRKESFESVERQVKESLLKTGPRFSICFKSEVVGITEMRETLTSSVEAFFKTEGVRFEVIEVDVGRRPAEFYDEHLHSEYVYGHLEGRVCF